MSQAPRRLRKLRVTEVSLVDRGANPNAKVILAKRDDAGDDPKMRLADRVVAGLRKMFGASASNADPLPSDEELIDQFLADDAANDTGAGSDVANDTPEEVPMSDVAIKAKDEEIAKLKAALDAAQAGVPVEKADAIAKAEAVAKAAQEQVEALTKTVESLTAINIAKQRMDTAEAVLGEYGDASARVAFATEVIGKLDEAGVAELRKFAEFVTEQTKLAKAMQPVGRSVVAPGSESARIEKRAAELRTLDPKLTPEQAYAAALVGADYNAIRAEEK